MTTRLSLYIHIPFCVRKCAYCDFLSYPADDPRRQDYLHALAAEIRASSSWLAAQGKIGPARATSDDADHSAPRVRPEGMQVDTIYLGGGTPSLLTPAQMTALLDAVRETYPVADDAEISMECNPGTVDERTLRGYRSAGVNRLSIGVQTFHEEELRIIGRIHTRQQAIECYEAARRAGYDNVSLDLISALPGQTRQSWHENLEMVTSLGPDHLSCYSLILEEGTPLLARYEAGTLPPLPDEETDRAMVHETDAWLAAHGYEQYEISNYARPGHACRHNIGYWTGHEYLGLGLGSSSYLQTTDGWIRCQNVSDPAVYEAHAADLSAIHENVEYLTPEDRMEEFLFLGLRMNQGVSEITFRERFGRDLEDVYPGITQQHVNTGLLTRQSNRIILTERGRDLANTVMSSYILTT